MGKGRIFFCGCLICFSYTNISQSSRPLVKINILFKTFFMLQVFGLFFFLKVLLSLRVGPRAVAALRISLGIYLFTKLTFKSP